MSSMTINMLDSSLSIKPFVRMCQLGYEEGKVQSLVVIVDLFNGNGYGVGCFADRSEHPLSGTVSMD